MSRVAEKIANKYFGESLCLCIHVYMPAIDRSLSDCRYAGAEFDPPFDIDVDMAAMDRTGSGTATYVLDAACFVVIYMPALDRCLSLSDLTAGTRSSLPGSRCGIY